MRKILKNETGILYCFTPTVMLITFVFEILAAAYVVIRYKMDTLTRLVFATLVCLAVFQLAEYNVCAATFGLDTLTWAKIGYASITLLPPLGIHIVLTLSGKKMSALTYSLYAIALLFCAYFLLFISGINGNQCMGNYVIFQVSPVASMLHGVYYWSLLLAGSAHCFMSASRMKANTDRHRRLALLSFGLGYLLFMVPTLIAIYAFPGAASGIPSIMCGFAVSLAVVMVAITLPEYKKSKNHRKSTKG